MQIRIAERRRSPRSPAHGSVKLVFRDPFNIVVLGELVDTNEGGFRLSHDNQRLTAGVEVHYSFRSKSGRARVVWTHVLEGRRVSGLVYI